MSKVYLVGAGPGDPGLITVKGRALIETADAILYDHLAPQSLLALARPDAERIYVGKKKSSHAFAQEEISAMLVERARRGLNVVRLKGGDPFVFARGGEELEALADAGVDFEVVPGVTTPLGIAAYTGVPLTHRAHTSVVTFVTGHEPALIDWDKVGASETLVIFMGLTSMRAIFAEILRRGRAPDTPAMVCRWATRPDQQTIVGTLSTLPALVEQSGMKPPATVIVGQVVALRERFNWFENLPLFGKRIVVTRAQEQAAEFSVHLRALGADVIEFPTIAIRPPLDAAPLDAAIARLDTYDWLIFTSVNGVRFFLERLDVSSFDLRRLRARLCAIGPATARAIEALHLKVDLVPREYVAESLIEALSSVALDGKRILLPRAAVARDVVPDELRARGALVDVVEAYRTAIPEAAAERAREVFSSGVRPDWITVTSSSTVKNLVAAAGAERLAGIRIASIGPVTSATARSLGLEVAAEAASYTAAGLVAALLQTR